MQMVLDQALEAYRRERFFTTLDETYAVLWADPIAREEELAERSLFEKTLADEQVAASENGGMTLDELRARRDEILQLAASHGASNVRVFGSVARGEARPDSDVDLLVDFEEGRSLVDLTGLIIDLEEVLGRKVDVGTEVREIIRDRVDRETVPL